MSAYNLTSSLSPSRGGQQVTYILDEQNSRNSNYVYFLENSFETKRNIAASYDTAAMVCVTCALKLGHKILLKRDTKAPHDYSSPAVFVLVDQSFPAYLHAHRR